MINRLQFSEFRASIFMPKVPYNGDILQKLLPKFKDFVPSVLHQSIELNGLRIENAPDMKDSTWELISSDNKTHIVFLDSKIDVLIHSNDNYSVDKLAYYAEMSFEFFRIICDHFKVSSSRVALAPTLRIDDISESEMKKLGDKVFKNSIFKGGSLTNASFTNVFRVNEEIQGKPFVINYNIKIKTQNQLKAEKGSIRFNNSLIAELDINSLPVPQYRFTKEHIFDFYNIAPAWANEFVNFYLFNQ